MPSSIMSAHWRGNSAIKFCLAATPLHSAAGYNSMPPPPFPGLSTEVVKINKTRGFSLISVSQMGTNSALWPEWMTDWMSEWMNERMASPVHNAHLFVIKMKNILKMTAKSCCVVRPRPRLPPPISHTLHFPDGIWCVSVVLGRGNGKWENRKTRWALWEHRTGELIIFLQPFVWWPSVVLFRLLWCHKCATLHVLAKCVYAALAFMNGECHEERSKPDAVSNCSTHISTYVLALNRIFFGSQKIVFASQFTRTFEFSEKFRTISWL